MLNGKGKHPKKKGPNSLGGVEGGEMTLESEVKSWENKKERVQT